MPSWGRGVCVCVLGVGGGGGGVKAYASKTPVRDAVCLFGQKLTEMAQQSNLHLRGHRLEKKKKNERRTQ